MSSGSECDCKWETDAVIWNDGVQVRHECAGVWQLRRVHRRLRPKRYRNVLVAVPGAFFRTNSVQHFECRSTSFNLSIRPLNQATHTHNNNNKPNTDEAVLNAGEQALYLVRGGRSQASTPSSPSWTSTACDRLTSGPVCVSFRPLWSRTKPVHVFSVALLRTHA